MISRFIPQKRLQSGFSLNIIYLKYSNDKLNIVID